MNGKHTSESNGAENALYFSSSGSVQYDSGPYSDTCLCGGLITLTKKLHFYRTVFAGIFVTQLKQLKVSSALVHTNK